MNKKFVLATSLLTAAIMSTNSQAFEFGKPITTLAVVTKPGQTLARTPAKKEVVLMNIRLTAKEQQAIFNYKPKISHKTSSDFNLPPAINLGMNGVPVLDQGKHGSCVTFATTAAIDAVLGKGDYVSQLCSLELGSTLEAQG